VAEAEMALARVLNDEAEKLGRIVASADDIGALLEANRAANRALGDVICKEQALARELERIVEICGACAPEPEDARAPGREDPKAFPGYKS
jgi:hypothetical protein